MLSGSELREIRKRHGLSQQQLAEMLEISPSQLSRLERGDAEITETVEEGALSLDLGAGVHAEHVSRENGDDPSAAAVAADELPSPPYDPADGEPTPSDEDTGEPEKKQRRRTAARSPRRRKLTAWQEETAAQFTALFQGGTTPMELDGEPVIDPATGRPIVVYVPGLAWVVGQFDQFDGMMLHQGSPALAQALVKLAPRHPFLRTFLDVSTAGDDYRELMAAVGAIMLPILAHHGMLPAGLLGGGAQQAASNGGQPAGETNVAAGA